MQKISILILLIGIGCTNHKTNQSEQMKTENPLSFETLTIENIEALRSKKIFFGHQSVGENILNGINTVLNENNITDFKVINTRDASEAKKSVLSHSQIGHNTKPITKLEDFESIMNSGLADSVDIAFMKFCYVDINKGTDVNELFNQYKATFSRLTEQHKNTIFIHFTAPLTRNPLGIKGKLKQKISGSDNQKREAYNEMIRNEYGGKVFDLAAYESTYPEGYREVLNKTYGLIPGYTTDGGHLNEEGARIIATQLLVFLAGVNN